MTYELTIEENDIDDNTKEVHTFTSKDKVIDALLGLLGSYTFMNPTLKRNWK
jgi:hypothetical protein